MTFTRNRGMVEGLQTRDIISWRLIIVLTVRVTIDSIKKMTDAQYAVRKAI